MFWQAYPERVRHARLACFDWDPFAACLPLDTIMLRQDMEKMIQTCFEWFDDGAERAGEVVIIPPRLVIGNPSESQFLQKELPDAEYYQP